MGGILLSECRDPAWNLALEEYLIGRGCEQLFLWRNEPSVILGRNQNPFRECSPRKLREQGVRLVRRKSGGGAVYHDPGNLNVTMLTPGSPGAVEENFRFLQRVLRTCGVEAQVSGRNDLEVGGRKISGSAFYEKDGLLCHHCTLLISVDLDRMQSVLTPSEVKLRAKGIESVRSRVANLQELVPELTVESVVEAFCRERQAPVQTVPREALCRVPEIARNAAVYRSRQWTLGETPQYNLQAERKFSWGTAEAELMVRSGVVESCRIYTDSLITEGFEKLGTRLTGLEFEGPEFLRTIACADLAPEIRRDLALLLEP